MNKRSYLIDTNILIGLEGNHESGAVQAKFHCRALAREIDICVHESAKDDIARDKNVGGFRLARSTDIPFSRNGTVRPKPPLPHVTCPSKIR